MRGVLSFLLLLSPASVFARDGYFTYPEQRISLKGVTEMKIVGVHGHLHLGGTRGGRFLRLKVRQSVGAKFDDWHLSVERRGHTLYLEVFNVAYGPQWRKVVRHEFWPTFDIDLNGAAIPTTVAWRDGALDVSTWNAPLEIGILKGNVRVFGGRGRLRLLPSEGAQISVYGHAGGTYIKGESGAITVARTKGPVDINWLSGDIALKNCDGHLRIGTGTSQVRIEGGRGDLDLQMAKGTVRVAAFNGKIQGRTEAADWDLAAAAPADVEINNTSGPVGLHWMGGGARVFLTSSRGPIDIQHSDFLSREVRGGHQVAQGIKTAPKMGQVFVRTDSGAIRWRQ